MLEAVGETGKHPTMCKTHPPAKDSPAPRATMLTVRNHDVQTHTLTRQVSFFSTRHALGCFFFSAGGGGM